MESEIIELRKKIEELTQINKELLAEKQDYSSAKQSFYRKSARLRKLCKRLAPTDDVVLEMRTVADEIRELTKQAVACPKEKEVPSPSNAY